MNDGINLDNPMNVESADQIAQRMKEYIKSARESIEEVQRDQAKYFNRSRRELVLNKGDLALLSIDGIEINNSPKYTHKYMGPFEIVDALENDNYALSLPHYMNIHNIFYISAKYSEPDASSFQAKLARPPHVDVVDEDKVFVIDRIVKHRFYGEGRKNNICANGKVMIQPKILGNRQQKFLRTCQSLY